MTSKSASSLSIRSIKGLSNVVPALAGDVASIAAPTNFKAYSCSGVSLLDLPNELILGAVEELDGYTIKNLMEAYPTDSFLQGILGPALISKIEKEGGKRSQLCWAAAGGDEKWFRRFLNEGFTNEERCTKGGFAAIGSTALHAAVIGGNLNIIDYLLSAGADMEAFAKGTGTPLQVAAIYGQTDIFKFLLRCGANIFALSCGNVGDTVLHQASAGGHNEIVEILLSNGLSNPNSTSAFRSMRNSLQYAIIAGKEKTVELLLRYGADPNEQDYCGENSLHISARCTKQAEAGLDQEILLSITKLLLAHNADVMFLNITGETAYHLAAQYGNEEMLAIFLENEDCLDYQNDNYETALHKAARFGHVGAARFLLSRGAEMGMVRFDGLTALEVALANEDMEMVNLLQEFEFAELVDELAV